MKAKAIGRHYLATFTLAVLGAACAHAGIILTLDQPNQTGAPGSTIHYFGTITNTGADPVFLNSDDLNLTALSGYFTVTDLFLDHVPISLAGGADSGDIELFQVLISDPFPGTFQSYGGTYGLKGGADSEGQEILGTVEFGITPEGSAGAAPEPASWLLLAAALAGVAIARQGRRH